MAEEKTKSERIEYLEEQGKELCEMLKSSADNEYMIMINILNYKQVIVLLIDAMLEEYDKIHHSDPWLWFYVTPYNVFSLMTMNELLSNLTVEWIGEKRNSIYNMVYGCDKRPFVGFKPGKINQSPIPLGFNNHKSKPFYTNCLRGNDNE